MAERFQIGASFSGLVTFEPREGDVVQIAEVEPPKDGRGMVVMRTVCYALGREHAERIVRALNAAPDEPPCDDEPELQCDGSRGALCHHQDPNKCDRARECPAFTNPP